MRFPLVWGLFSKPPSPLTLSTKQHTQTIQWTIRKRERERRKGKKRERMCVGIRKLFEETEERSIKIAWSRWECISLFFYDSLNDEEEKVFAYKEGKKCQTVSIPSTRALQTQSGSHVRFFLPAHLDAVHGVEQAHKRAYRGLATFSPAFRRIRRTDLVLTMSIDFSCSPGKKALRVRACWKLISL